MFARKAPVWFWLFLILLVVLPIVLILFFLEIIDISFAKLGLSPMTGVLLLILSLVGSVINLPISRRRIVLEEQRSLQVPFSLLFYAPPRVREQTIAINIGGAVIPTCFSIYLLLTKAPLWQTVVATIVVAAFARMLARPRPGVGIVMPVWIPPLLAVALALLLSRHNAPPVAYISGTMGTLIGADLLNFPAFKRLGAHVLSIGGAGVFDGIFLVGILAALLA
jgi:uncharacterized membrane protein